MADLLIPNMKLPKRQSIAIYIHPNGQAFYEDGNWPNLVEKKVIELPPHGTLKDTDFMLSCLEEIKKDYPEAYKLVRGIIERTPTVVEVT